MIVDHYYMREIGQETIGQFIHYAKATMNELMEEYLPLVYSSSIEFELDDPVFPTFAVLLNVSV